MFSQLRKLLSPDLPTTTYGIGLLQAKAYRTLKQNTNHLLTEYNINTLEWALIGHLSEYKEQGMSSTEAASLLGVAAPFITVMVQDLERKKLLHKKRLPEDKRENRIFLTDKGLAIVPEVEKKLRTQFKSMLGPTALPYLNGYIRILLLLAR